MNKILIIDDDKELCELLQRSVLVENINADVAIREKMEYFFSQPNNIS